MLMGIAKTEIRAVLWGSSEESLPSLRKLADMGILRAVCTVPDRPARRGLAVASSPVKRAALGMGVAAHTPEALGPAADLDFLEELEPDLFVVVSYGRILPRAVLERARLGGINLHPSYLPAYRGTSPVAAAILDGAAETGASLIVMNERMDAGPVLAVAPPRPIGPETAREGLQAALFRDGAELLPRAIAELAAGTARAAPQDESAATYTPKLSRGDGEVDWGESAELIARKVRAYEGWPGVFSSWGGRRLKLLAAAPLAHAVARAARANGNGNGLGVGEAGLLDGRLAVGCGEGALELVRLQLESRRAMAAEQFLGGAPKFIGAKLPS